jgi:hypothetical protein
VGINIMPVLPGITDRPDALEALVRQVAADGASHINACALRLRVTSRRRYLPWLDEEFPDLAPRYRKAYGNRFQITDRYREGLRQFLKRACRQAGIRYGSPEERAFEGPAAARRRTTTARRDAPARRGAPAGSRTRRPAMGRRTLHPVGASTRRLGVGRRHPPRQPHAPPPGDGSIPDLRELPGSRRAG